MQEDDALRELGFNQLESAVYCELLRRSPATGYRLSQRLGRAPANIYQTLNSLTHKEAVLAVSDDGDAVSYVPVPPEQLMGVLRAGFDGRASRAMEMLARVKRTPAQEVLTQLRSVPQVVERARAMIAGAAETIVFDMMPPMYDLLRAEFDAARARGVRLAGIAYRAEDAEPSIPFKGEPPTDVYARWPGLGLILVTDAREQLVAQVSSALDQVFAAVYTDSLFISCLLHGLLVADIRLVDARTAGVIADHPAIDALELRRSLPPGLRALLDPAVDPHPQAG